MNSTKKALCWLVLIVYLTQRRITAENSLHWNYPDQVGLDQEFYGEATIVN